MDHSDGTHDGELTVLYRGPLASCNYGCGYCPFAKRPETPVERAADAAALDRLLAWARGAARPLRIFFTPWGEALHHTRYREALIELSRLPQVRQVAVQTNLAGSLDWLAAAQRASVALWATYHPTQVSRERFLARSATLRRLGIAHSVGVVGTRDAIGEIEALRADLPAAVPVWVNAFSMTDGAAAVGYYRPDEIARLRAVDPHFEVGLLRLSSRGQSCRTGDSVISVDGDGSITRCHFDARVLGNLWHDDLTEILRPRPCRRPVCDCHIGYVHLEQLGAQQVYGRSGLLARIPLAPPDHRVPDPTAYLTRARRLLTPAPHPPPPSPSPSPSTSPGATPHMP